MVKLKSLLSESKILIPRRTPEEREKTHIAEHYRIIQRYIRDGCQGGLNLRKSPIKILPDNLTHVGGNLNLDRSKIEDLNNLEEVDGYLGLYDCENLKSLGKLKRVDGFLNLYKSQIKILPDNLIRVGGELSLYDSKIEDLNNLEEVDGYLNLKLCKNLKSLGKLKKVISLNIEYSAIETLNNLEYVIDSLYGTESNLRDLGKLKSVGQFADFDFSYIETLGNLESVGISLFIRDTPNLKSLGKLKHVGSEMYLYKSNLLNILSMEDIKTQVRNTRITIYE
jgi:hypothetical protein